MNRALNMLRKWKHLTLLATLLGLIFLQPVARSGMVGLIVYDILITIATAVIFFVVFERRSTAHRGHLACGAVDRHSLDRAPPAPAARLSLRSSMESARCFSVSP